MSGTFPPPLPLDEQVRHLHLTLSAELPGIHRIAVAIYNPKTDMLNTFVSSDENESPLTNYQKKLSDVPSLLKLVKKGKDRVVDDLRKFQNSPEEHSKVISERFGSSYTRALVDRSRLRGFVFFDSKERAYFTPSAVARLSLYSELISVMLTRSMVPGKILSSAIEVAGEISHSRDPETGAHLDRMSHYTFAIGLAVAKRHQLSDTFLQDLLHLAPLHDIGKVAIPDNILLKNASLSKEEFRVMQKHTTKGAAMIDRLVERLSLETLPQASILHNIVLYHHERYDGSGYPAGLKGHDIPIEARIVAVADVYDALTTERPYKSAWPPAAACAHLDDQAGKHFDPEIVAGFHSAFEQIEEIRETFRDDAETLRFREGYDEDL